MERRDSYGKHETGRRHSASSNWQESEDREEITRDRGYWAIGVMAIQSEGAKKAITQEERRCRMNLKLDSKESRYKTMLISMERRQRRAMDRRWVEAQHRQNMEELKYKQLAEWADIWYKELLERMVQLQHRGREDIREEEAEHLRKLGAGKRRLTNSMEGEREGRLTVEELEDINQYQVPMAIDPSTVAGIHNATEFASERRRKQPSDGRERSPRPKKRSRNQDPA